MGGLTLQLAKRRTNTGKKGKAPVDDSLREINVRPRRRFVFGRHLAFAIDDSSVQMAVVSHYGRAKRIRDVRKVSIPPELIGVPAQSDFIANTVENYIDTFGRLGSKVSLAISGKETVLRTFLTPMMKKRQLATAVHFEAKKQIPFALEDCIYDYRTVTKIIGAGKIRFKVTLHAATRRLVDENLEPFRQRKITVSWAYHSQEAIGQCLRHLSDYNVDKHYTLINIDHDHSEISFYRGSLLEFYHVATIGSSILGKRSGQEHFENFAQLLATEIQTSLDYYAGQYQRSTSDKVFVYGDLAYNNALFQMLKRHTGFEFERFPAEKLNFVSTDKYSFARALPVCLPALASSVCDVNLANLLPAEDRLRLLIRKIHSTAQVGLAILLLVLTIGWGVLKAKTTIAEHKLVDFNQQVESFKNSPAYHTYNQLMRQIASDRAYIDKVKELPSYLSLNLKELSLLTPPTIRLFHLAYQTGNTDRNFTIQGVATSKDIPPEIIVAEYVETLNSSPFFEKVTLSKHVKRKVRTGFEIEFQIEMWGIV
ncbi:MAG: pilus assembly protein PilM [Candidatus Zixiibacteriota bacterium]